METATKLCSVAIGKDGVCISFREEQTEKLSHAEKLNVFAAQVLKEAGLSFDLVDAFAVGIGPGSYTGSRIGVSAAKGWAYALEKRIIGITTLRTLAQAVLREQLMDPTELWPMIDARRMEVFTQCFSPSGQIMGDPMPVILDPEWIAQRPDRTVVFGDGADKAEELWSGEKNIVHLSGITSSARHMIAVAEQRYNSREFDDLAYLVPQYGKPANVAQPRKQ
ncbi:MAG: tRNA (adenosine(37)-N6)-threonylcarbamoyltransferase complex dimerization subunit type 1 TsaB [Bacteroidota bacterium]|nr:tRNA (adenosine(37)-N6)-threonylcarbamoyltransferase complex dimerization subunit type 1 TsaB [Bacteroidota bacterium]